MLEVRFHDNDENGCRDSRGYTAYVSNNGFSDKLDELIPGNVKVMIITDENVAPLWFDCVRNVLIAGGRNVFGKVLPAGEEIKRPEYLFSLWQALEENGFRRSDYVIALGGGTVGDLAGFAAATYMRGIHLIQMPTSLLACVDSCAGGKTAVDLPTVKNGAGVFRRPDAIIADTLFLSTLPEREFSNGMAEVVKYGLACDPAVLDCVREAADGYKAVKNGKGNVTDSGLDKLIARCLGAKKKYVEADEFDTGKRMALNFGHTIGHSIEILSDYGIKHGAAVAAGCCIILRAEAEEKMLDRATAEDTEKLLESLGLPTNTDYPAEELAKAAEADKKNTSDVSRLVLLRKPGEPFVRNFTVPELVAFISKGL